jgi:hypothetical protein
MIVTQPLEIHLPCGPTDLCVWKEPLETIDQAAGLCPLIWKLDCGVEEPWFPLEDEALYQAIRFALNHFTETLFPRYADRTVGLCLYDGSFDFAVWLRPSFEIDRQQTSWFKENPIRGNLLNQRLFARNLYIAYLQKLAIDLPDQMLPTLRFDLTSSRCPMSWVEEALFFSSESFEHFALEGVAGRTRPREEAPLALCIPPERLCTEVVLRRMESWYTSLTVRQSVRWINEAYLNEEWEGVEVLYVVAEALSPLGQRKVRGFQATGGEVIHL